MRVYDSSRLVVVALVFLPELTTAWSFPQIKLPFTRSGGSQVPLGTEPEELGGLAPVRIAIIGAGAAGSSSAFWISKARERHGADVVVDVYEQSDHIGGRK